MNSQDQRLHFLDSISRAYLYHELAVPWFDDVIIGADISAVDGNSATKVFGLKQRHVFHIIKDLDLSQCWCLHEFACGYAGRSVMRRFGRRRDTQMCQCLLKAE